MASRTTTDPIEILLEMGVDLDNLSSEEDYLSALMEAAATIEFQTKGSGDERSAVLRKEIIEVRKKRKAADPNFKAKKVKISKSSFKPKAKPAGPKALPTSALVPYKKPEEEEQPKSEQKKEKIKSDKSQGLLESILKNVIGIKALLQKRIDITKSIRDIERKNLQKQKRKAKEDKLEEGKRGKNFLKKLKGAVPRLGIFDYIFNWIKNVIFGKILIKIIDWMSDPKNKKKLDSLGRFLKDWWPALTAAFIMFATPLGGFIRAVVSGMVRLTGFLLKKAIPTLLRLIAKNPIAALALATVGVTAIGAYNASQAGSAVIKDPKKPDKSHLDEIMDSGGMTGSPMGGLFSGGGGVPDWLAMAGGGNAFMKPMGTDTVPAMLSPGEFVMSKGAVDTFGSDFMEGINAAGGGTNKPKVMGGTTYAQGGGLVSHHKALLDAISFAEGTTKSYGTIFGGKVVPELEQGKLTIDQVHNMMMTGKLNGRDVGYKTGGKFSSVATGRYQFMPDTLRDIQRNMGLSGDTLFTPEMQDKMIIDRITDFRNVSLNELKTEGLSTKVLDKLAPEFASLPYSPKGGKSYYDQPVKSAEDIRNAFKKSLGGANIGPNTGSGRDGTFGDGTYGSGRPSDPKPSGDPIHPKDDPGLRHRIPDNAGTDSLGNRNYGFKTGDSDTVGLKGKNYHFTKTEDGWKVTDGGFYGMNKQPVDPKTVPGLVRAFHTKYGHRGTGRNRDGSDNPNDPYKPKTTTDTTTDNSKKDKKTKAKIDKGGAFTDIFAGARARQQTKKATFSSSYIAPNSSDSSDSSSSSSSSSPSPKIDPTKVTNNPTNLTTNVDFNVGDVTLDPTMQLKDLPGGMDANKLARSHAETKQLSPEQTELLAKQAVKFTKKNGRAPTKSEINKLSVNIFGADVGKKVTDPEVLKLIDEEKNINKSKLTPIPLDKVAPTDKLKPVKKDTTQVIDAPPAGSPGAAPQPKANNPQEPDFPTISQSREAQEVRAAVMANTLGGDFA